jgi:hypothetical protein
MVLFTRFPRPVGDSVTRNLRLPAPCGVRWKLSRFPMVFRLYAYLAVPPRPVRRQRGGLGFRRPMCRLSGPFRVRFSRLKRIVSPNSRLVSLSCAQFRSLSRHVSLSRVQFRPFRVPFRSLSRTGSGLRFRDSRFAALSLPTLPVAGASGRSGQFPAVSRPRGVRGTGRLQVFLGQPSASAGALGLRLAFLNRQPPCPDKDKSFFPERKG